MRRNRNPTERELQVLKLVAAGCRYSEIGHILFIGERTVQNHMSTIMLKLNACNSHHATAIALHRRLILASDIPQLEALGIFS
jgi:DNA-binding CsgD family transcriptional regulator